MTGAQTTYERAQSSYDDAHEKALITAISTTIAEASMVTDANALVFRTGEIVQALIVVLGGTLAMSPASVRSPTAIRKIAKDIEKNLRRQVASAEASEDLQSFLRRSFRGNGEGGNA